MASGKKILKISIIVVLLIFLLSTGLISVLYLGGTKNVAETEEVITDELMIETDNIPSDN
jgi:flagellar basal body-associated protein FliL